jgi:hypothetical protein
MIKKFLYWIFCKLDDPIYSPSKAGFLNDCSCLFCGKVHGTLFFKQPTMVIDYAEPGVKDQTVIGVLIAVEPDGSQWVSLDDYQAALKKIESLERNEQNG